MHMPAIATRLNSFQSGGTASVLSAITTMGSIPGLTALELNYPQHFRDVSPKELGAAAETEGLTITGINLRYDDPAYATGAFTNPDSRIRQRAIDLTIEAGRVAIELGATHLILWMGPDGFDYPFQASYEGLWADEIDGFRQVSASLPGLRISVEYKPGEPRRFSLIRSIGEALLATREVGLPNFGVTVDVCHAQMAGEHPAAAVGLALREHRLFGLHLNDGYGRADDGLMVGSVNPWTTLEILFLIKRHGYDGTLYFDTFPGTFDASRETASNIRTVQALWNALDEQRMIEIANRQQQQDPFILAGIGHQLLRYGE